MRKRWLTLGVFGAVAAALYLANTSRDANPTGELTILARRGVHQPFEPADGTCTAAHSLPGGHSFIENTLSSIDAAFYYGADMVEIDVQPTTDGEFAVFQDWTLDCRTNGEGVTREHSMAELKKLDVGYGYTTNGGRTFPLRGRGVGLMPTLRQVLKTFPDRRFLIDLKSDDPREADLLQAYLKAAGAGSDRLVVMGGARQVERLRALDPGLKTVSSNGAEACLKDYMLTGWYGKAPASCRNALVAAPYDLAGLPWGWPGRFLERMQKAGTEVYIGGRADFPLRNISGFDDPAEVKRLPKAWKGGVVTDRIELIGPALETAGE